MSIKVLQIEIEICTRVCVCACVKWLVVFPQDTVLIGEWELTGSKVCWEFKP